MSFYRKVCSKPVLKKWMTYSFYLLLLSRHYHHYFISWIVHGENNDLHNHKIYQPNCNKELKNYSVIFSNSVNFIIFLFFWGFTYSFLIFLGKCYCSSMYLVCIISTLHRKSRTLWFEGSWGYPLIFLFPAGWCLTFLIGRFIISTKGFFSPKICPTKKKIYLTEATHSTSISHAHFSMN